MSLADEMRELAAVSTSEELSRKQALEREHKIKTDELVKNTAQIFRYTIQQQAKIGMTDCVLKCSVSNSFDFDMVRDRIIGILKDDGFTVLNQSNNMDWFICLCVSWK